MKIKSTKFVCNKCGYQGKEEEFKEENNPSSRYELLIGCPNCKAKEITVYEQVYVNEDKREEGAYYWSSEVTVKTLSLNQWMKLRKRRKLK